MLLREAIGNMLDPRAMSMHEVLHIANRTPEARESQEEQDLTLHRPIYWFGR